MLIRTTLIIILVSLNLILAGCNGSHEPDAYAYIVALGFDKADEPGKIAVSFQIGIPRSTSSEGTPEGEPGKNSFIITIKAVSLAEAYNLLNSTLSFTPTLTHTKMIVFGEKFAREGIQNVIGPIMRFREYRGSMHVAVTRGTARELFENNQPSIDMTPSKYYELMMESSSESGYYLDSSLNTFYKRLKSHSAQAYAVLTAVNPTSGSGLPADTPVPEGKAETYIAGNMQRENGNKIDFLGTALFRGDKLVDMLDNDETRMLTMLIGSYKKGFLTVTDPLKTKSGVNVNLSLERNPRFTTRIQDGVPYIGIELRLEGYISAIPSGIHYEKEEYLSLLEQQVSQVITERIQKMLRKTQQAGSDAVGFGYYFRQDFLTRPDFNDFNWNDRYSEAKITLQVKTHLHRNGLMFRTNEIQGK